MNIFLAGQTVVGYVRDDSRCYDGCADDRRIDHFTHGAWQKSESARFGRPAVFRRPGQFFENVRLAAPFREPRYCLLALSQIAALSDLYSHRVANFRSSQPQVGHRPSNHLGN